MMSPSSQARALAAIVLLASIADAFRPAHLPPRSSTSLAAATRATTSSSRAKRLSSLATWSDTAGVKTGGVAVQNMDGTQGLGLVTQQEVPSGSVITTVPTDVALTIELPSGGPDDASVISSDLCTDRRAIRDLPWYAQFSFYLYKLDQISSTKKGVELRPWLDTLPRAFDTPLHWSPEDRDEWLQYPYLTDAISRQETEWKNYYNTLQSSTTSKVDAMTFDDFCWGAECARSRAFSGAYTGSAFNPLIYAFTLLLITAYVGLNLGTLEQASNGAALVVCGTILRDFVLPKLLKTKKYVICPVIDMCNHVSVGTSAQVAFEFFTDAYSLSTNVNVPSGDQVYISYGARSNDQLLQYYGFVEADNPHDVYVMPPLRNWDIAKLEEACGAPFPAGRLAKLARAGLLGLDAASEDSSSSDEDALTSSGNPLGGVVVTRTSEFGIDPAVFQALRALVSTDAEWTEAGEAVGNFAAPINADNERRARLAAKTGIKLELASKSTTLAQDLELLKRKSAMSDKERLALAFRIEKKRLLEEAMTKLQ